MTAKQTQVLVIGAGLAGLTAAWRLQQAGISVQILESSSRAGGRVCTVQRDGYLFDIGADALTSGYVEYLALVRELGMEKMLQRMPTVIGTVRGGRVVYMNPASNWSMLISRSLSFGAKLRLALGFRKVTAIWGNTPLAQMHRLAPIDDDRQSARVNSEKLFGREVTDYLIDPMVRTVNGLGIDASSWVEVVGGIGLAPQETFCLRGGQDILPLAMAQGLDIRYGCRATGIAAEEGGVVISMLDDQGREQSIEAQGCVLATMYEAGIELYPMLEQISREYRQRLAHMKLCKVQLCYKTRTHTKAAVIQIPGIEDPETMLVFLDHNKCDDRAPPGHSMITIYTETRVAQKYLPQSDDALVAWGRRKAEHWFPELADHYSSGLVTRWPMMAPAATPGHYARAAGVLERVATDSRVQVACDMFSKTCQESAVAWGATAARNLTRVLSGA